MYGCCFLNPPCVQREICIGAMQTASQAAGHASETSVCPCSPLGEACAANSNPRTGSNPAPATATACHHLRAAGSRALRTYQRVLV